MTVREETNRFFNGLVEDCISYRLTEAEALVYIRMRYKNISPVTYRKRKKQVIEDPHFQQWLNYFTRIGFVRHHKKQMEDIQRVQDDTLRAFILESQQRPRNEERIMAMGRHIRENAMALSELGLGTPIIAAIKAKLAEKDKPSLPPIQVDAKLV